MHGRKISVVGLGYVGLPVAIAFGKQGHTIGFDINEARLAELREGYDRTREVAADDLASSDIRFTSDIAELASADFHIVAVPTPVDDAHQPDLTPVVKASETVARALKRGAIVVYESTVYPGATEESAFRSWSGFPACSLGADFTVGYCPERINPGDKEHTLTKILKVVSASDAETLEVVAAVYGSVVTAGVHQAASIKVAEAAKVIENTQRDLNIALMNELAIIFDRMSIDTLEVLEAAGTKWNFLPVQAGPRRRTLHRRRSVLSDAQGREARLHSAGHSRWAPDQRRHGRFHRTANHQGNDPRRSSCRPCEGDGARLDLQGKLP